MKICQLTNSTEKQAVTRSILEALPEWFGIPEASKNRADGKICGI